MTSSNKTKQTPIQRLRALILAVCAIALLMCLIGIGRAVYVSALENTPYDANASENEDIAYVRVEAY